MTKRLAAAAALAACAALGLTGVGCDDKSGGGTASNVSVSPDPGANTKTASATTASSGAARTTMPYLEVDEKGPAVGIDHFDLTKPDQLKNFHLAFKDLPVTKVAQSFVAARNAKTSDVAALVRELALAGATSVTIKTEGRGDLPKELTVTPEMKVDKPDKCSIVATVTEDGATAVWAFEGGTAASHRKGLAGPDLSHTQDTLVKAIPACSSKTAYFSASAKHPWEFAFNIGGSILKADEKKQLERLVLVADEPVAGRPVKLRSD